MQATLPTCNLGRCGEAIRQVRRQDSVEVRFLSRNNHRQAVHEAINDILNCGQPMLDEIIACA
jgi:hypothetical protein